MWFNSFSSLRNRVQPCFGAEYQKVVCLLTFWLFLIPWHPQSSPSHQTLGLECVITVLCLQSNYSLIWLVSQQDDKSAGCQAGSEISHYPMDCRQRPHQDAVEASSQLQESTAVCVSLHVTLWMKTWTVFKMQDPSMHFGFLIFLWKTWQSFWSKWNYFFCFYVNFKWNMQISQH